MAPKYFIVLFLLAWKVDFIGCSNQFNCDQASYSNTFLTTYIVNCMMKKEYGWDEFFNWVPDNVWDALNPKLEEEGNKKINNIKNAIEPRMPLIFQALKLVQPKDIKVVILGQDPTPQPGKATGLAFSVENPRFVPAALSMLLEVAFEGFPVNLNKAGVLKWAEQGVLLLNTAFTCLHKQEGEKKKNPGHFAIWKDFTNKLISYITKVAKPSVWLLWGGKAHEFKDIIEGEKINVNQNGQIVERAKHLVIEGGHPSPTGKWKFGDSFFGGSYFICANQFLESKRGAKIDWSLSDNGFNSLNQCPQFKEEQRQLELRHQQQLHQVLPYNYQQLLEKQQKERKKLQKDQQEQFQLQQPHQQELYRLHQKVLQQQEQIHYLQQRQQQLQPHQHY